MGISVTGIIRRRKNPDGFFLAPMRWIGGVLESFHWSVDSLFDDVGGESVVAADADGVPGEHARLLFTPARQAEVAERGEEDLSVVGGHQIVQDRVDGWAHIEEHIGDHVEVVVEVIELAAERERVSLIVIYITIPVYSV